jgi:HEAT repeat protein
MAKGKVARDAIVVATLADSTEVYPSLLRIAKDASREQETRKSAVFWLGQAASDATAALNGLAEDESGDVEIRKQAVFALSQRPADEAVPALLTIARGKLDPRVRRQAIFWLGQSGDPRAVSYFEDVLTKH